MMLFTNMNYYKSDLNMNLMKLKVVTMKCLVKSKSIYKLFTQQCLVKIMAVYSQCMIDDIEVCDNELGCPGVGTILLHHLQHFG